MSGLANVGTAVPLEVLRTSTPIGATEATLLGIVPIKGYGTIRVVLFSDVDITFRVYVKARRISATSLTTMRLFASRTVAASGNMETLIFNVHGDYASLRAVPPGGVAPTIFECSAQLVP